MKTIGTVGPVILAMAIGSALLDLATGLPLMFALLALVSAVALGFAATVVIGALVSPERPPLSLAIRGEAGRLPLRPVTRPVRVAA